MSPAFNLNAIAEASSVQIVYCLVEGTLIAVFTAAALGLSRRQNSVTRFAVWFSALMAIATLPFLTGSFWSHAASGAQGVVSHPAITLPGSWAVYLFGAWATIAGWRLAGIGRGLSHLHTLRKSCVAIDPARLEARLRETMARNQSPRRIALCTSESAQVPTALGLVKPAVVIPEWVMRELSPDELNQILLHELAHLRRWDDWTNLAQKIVKALFFFHPAVWWIEQRVSIEREMACDEAVLVETARPRAYAECLAHLAEKTLIQRSIALAQAALGKLHQTSQRVSRILDANRPAATARSWKPAVSLVAGFAVACVLGIARAPRLIAFSDIGASQVAAQGVTDSTIDAASGDVLRSLPMVNVSQKIARPESDGRRFPGAPFVSHAARGPRQYKQTKLTELANHGQPNEAEQRARDAAAMQAIDAQAVGEEHAAPGMYHLVNATAEPLAFTETFLIVIEGRGPGPFGEPAFQIQMWRVMVLHPVVDPNSNRIPPKRT